MDKLEIQGQIEFIESPEKFAWLLEEKLGRDAADYFNSFKDDFIEQMQSDPLQYCVGECDRVYETQRHYENQLDTVLETLRKLYSHLHELTTKHPKTNYGLGLCAEAMGHCNIPFKERAKKK
jgi:hypothetical protein